MVRKTLATFQVDYLQILDEHGTADEKLMPTLTDRQVLELYEAMQRSRAFDAKAVALQRQGRMGTYASLLGQEAAQIGAAYALEKDDWLVPSFRECGAMILRGHPMAKLYQFWGGDERGHDVRPPPFTLPIAIPVGSQTLHAAGIGMALKLQKKKAAVLCFFGDGATSKGDFHEALNFAGVFRAPVVFVCQNNQWAISVAREHQTAAQTLAQKAIAYGFEGIQVDGNDVFAVYAAAADALKKAKSGKGPTLIEAFTYRIADHTTSDAAKKYRSEAEVEQWKRRDPISRLRKYLEQRKRWSAKDESALQERLKQEVEAAVKEFEEFPKPPPENIFRYTFKEMPAGLREQLAHLRQSEGG